MNNPTYKPKKNRFAAFKIILASISVSGLFGLWSILNKNNQESLSNSSTTDSNALNAAIPTLVPSVLDNTSGDQALKEIVQATPQATATPVVERVVISSSGQSGGGSASRTSSSR